MQINRLSSSFPTFRSLQFRKGFNILLADQHDTSGDSRTRNGTGKTTSIELISYLLGGQTPPGSLRQGGKKLLEETYQLDFCIDGQDGSITRTPKGTTRNSIIVSSPSIEHTLENLIERGPRTKVNPKQPKIGQLQQALGHSLFALGKTPAHGPTYRACLSYFIRSYFDNLHYGQQDQRRKPEYQTNLAYLFGFDWDLLQQNISNNTKRSELTKLRSTIKKVPLIGYSKDPSALESRTYILEAEILELDQALKSFNVIPEYRKLEQESTNLNQQMRAYALQNSKDLDIIQYIEDSLTMETPPEQRQIQAVYQEAGVVLPDHVCQRLDQLETFHATITENRQNHLETEFNTLQKKIDSRQQQQQSLSISNQEILKRLSEGGAFDELMALQERKGKAEFELHDIRNQLANVRKLTSMEKEYKAKQLEYERLIDQSITEQQKLKSQIIITFEKLSASLYESAGHLEIQSDKGRLNFHVAIQGRGSGGVDKMQIFCFDLTLAIVTAQSGHNPGFLIHDSRLFDESDERQVASALNVAKTAAINHNFQYIAAFNSDRLKSIESDLSGNLVTPVLDDSDEGSLFGYQF